MSQIFISDKLYKKLNEIAENEKRALNDVIENALKQYVQEKEDYLRTDR